MVRHTRIALGLIAAGLAIAPASAANWQGFYIGLHAGGATGDIDLTNVSEVTGNEIDLSPGETIATSPDGVLGGAQLGYNFQMTNWVLGLEAAASGLDFDDTAPNTNLGGGVEYLSTEIEWLATGTARVGMSAMNSLFYLKGGYATGSVKTEQVDTGADATRYSTDETHHGWVAGAGVEHQIGSQVSFGVEYNYIDLGETDHAAIPTGGGTIVNDMDVQMHTVMAKLNWNFFAP
jgi:outer membrane immunogenic protein